eukprot:Transcript_15113.p1 GENE.Transcript_15113~~Transcript_15113.p1  ORF type:complete len:394 (+),score=150.56 Transcript_15113:231-1412(+)
MKFGRLLQQANLPDDWPMVRYKQLKQFIKARSARKQTIFDTGCFKKALRDDMIKINAFWRTKETELREQRQASLSLEFLAEQYRAEVRKAHKYLTLNYLAVLKITKKHDKQCDSCLAQAVSKVLMSQPFVVGLLTSEHFREAPQECAAAVAAAAASDESDDENKSGSTRPPACAASVRASAAPAAAAEGVEGGGALEAAPEAAERSRGGGGGRGGGSPLPARATSHGTTRAQISRLLGEGALKYMPQSVMHSISEGEMSRHLDLDMELDTGDGCAKEQQLLRLAIARSAGAAGPSEGERQRLALESTGAVFEHGQPLPRAASPWEVYAEWIPALLGSAVFISLAVYLGWASDDAPGAAAGLPPAAAAGGGENAPSAPPWRLWVQFVRSGLIGA